MTDLSNRFVLTYNITHVKLIFRFIPNNNYNTVKYLIRSISLS